MASRLCTILTTLPKHYKHYPERDKLSQMTTNIQLHDTTSLCDCSIEFSQKFLQKGNIQREDDGRILKTIADKLVVGVCSNDKRLLFNVNVFEFEFKHCLFYLFYKKLISGGFLIELKYKFLKFIGNLRFNCVPNRSILSFLTMLRNQYAVLQMHLIIPSRLSRVRLLCLYFIINTSL